MSPLLQYLLVLGIIIFAAKAAGLISSWLRQPAVLGELLAGLILGPSLLDLLQFFPDPSLEGNISNLAVLGVIALMFVAGLETDLAELRQVGRIGVIAGTLGVVVPFLLGAAVVYPFQFDLVTVIYIGLILTATSVSISARTLMDLGVMSSRAGVSILAAAVVDDILVIVLLSLLVAFVGDASAGVGDVASILIRMVVFFLITLGVGLTLLPRLSGWVARLPISEGLTSLAMVVTLFAAWLAEYLGGLALITGAYVSGVLFARSPLHHVIAERMKGIIYGFFVPIFFIEIGLSANVRDLQPSHLILVLVIVVIAVISKIVGCGGGAWLGGADQLDSLRIGMGMVSRGEVGLIVASVGITEGIIGRDIFTVVVLMVLVTTLITPVLLQQVFHNAGEVQYAQSSGSGDA